MENAEDVDLNDDRQRIILHSQEIDALKRENAALAEENLLIKRNRSIIMEGARSSSSLVHIENSDGIFGNKKVRWFK